jgi:NADPH2:quinone reductase
MRAAIYERTGPAAEVLNIQELPTPAPGPREVRVRVMWSGVNPSDVKSRAGLRTKTLAFPRIVPHSDGAGIIDRVGEGVDLSRIGERVWLWNGAWGRAFGTAAEFIVLPEAQAVKLPDGVDLASGACLGIPALTAYHAVAVDGGVAGRTVLVAGGAGAVGHYAIQFAKLKGAKHVVATVSSEAKATVARDAGADLVIDYKTEDVARKCLDCTGGAGVDRIIEVDFAANVKTDLAALRPEGDIVVYGSGAPEIPVPFFASIVKNLRMRFFIVYNLSADDRMRAIADLTELLEANRLRHNIAARLPLERIAEAHQLVERAQAIGNVVVEIARETRTA